MNKKFLRLFQPGMRLAFIVVILLALSTALADRELALYQGGVVVILLIYAKIVSNRQKGRLLEYVEELSWSVESARKENLVNFPLPMVIFRLITGEIVWSNQRFMEITGKREHFFETVLSDAVPGFDTKWLIEGKTEYPELVEIQGRKYRVFGNIVHTDAAAADTRSYSFLGNAYWLDVTDFADRADAYRRTRPICSLIVLDNYEELLQSLTQQEKGAVLAQIDEKISAWSQKSHGFLCKFDRDRYAHIFEEQYLSAYIKSRFALLDEVREITNSLGIAATISIGIGKDSEQFDVGFEYAKLGIEMALARGGDQAVIKNRYKFDFFGGRATEQERRTKVKSRVTAASLQKLMRRAGSIFIMGHQYADFDSLGTACGICCIARKLGKTAKIIIRPGQHAVGPMLEQLRKTPEYEHIFTTPADALVEADSTSLLVIVDTNRPDQVEAPAVLEAISDVVVIDHHRRAADYIQNAAINFHEPYASSSAELMTELLQYTVEQADILRVEAEALMAGIVMDTKNFTMRTGSRTFEAAAFLRRAGASTTEVKRFMQNDFRDAVARYDVIRQAEIYRTGIVIAAPNSKEDRVVGAQAADELLNISGIQASFVVYPTDTGVSISARSIGDINVQLILEPLGGGGNKNTAGAQIKGKNHGEVVNELKGLIDDLL